MHTGPPREGPQNHHIIDSKLLKPTLQTRISLGRFRCHFCTEVVVWTRKFVMFVCINAQVNMNWTSAQAVIRYRNDAYIGQPEQICEAVPLYRVAGRKNTRRPTSAHRLRTFCEQRNSRERQISATSANSLQVTHSAHREISRAIRHEIALYVCKNTS